MIDTNYQAGAGQRSGDAPVVIGAEGRALPPSGLDVRGAPGVQVNTGYGLAVQNNYYASGGGQVLWPARVGRAPLLADAFQARPGLRGRVDAALAGGGSAVVTQVVAGDGGTGKTQLAASVFRDAAAGLDLGVWVSASSREAIVAAYAEARAVTYPGGGLGDGERDAAAFLAWLEGCQRSWMVVLDDVADPADLTGLWPEGRCGRVLVTTRRRDAAVGGHGRAVVDVGVYIPHEAGEFLARKLNASTVPGVLDQAGLLAADVGFLPLALAQAGAVVLDEALTCAQYRTRLADRSRRLAEVFGADTGDGYERTVATTWSIAVERADALSPRGLCGRVLQLAAVLDPNGAPEDALIGGPAVDYLSQPHAADGPPSASEVIRRVGEEDARRAVRNLHRLSLLTHDPAAGPRAVRMHALAQRAALERLAPDALSELVRAAADGLVEAWPEVDRDPDLAQVLRANVSAVAQRAPDALWAAGAHLVLFRAGRSLGEVGQVAAARDYFTELAADAAIRLGPDHPTTLRARCSTAIWRAAAGNPAGAVATFEALLPATVRAFGPDHPTTLRARRGLAWSRGEAGDPASAVAALVELLPDTTRALGPDHLDTLQVRFGLARWRGEAGDPAGAVAAFEVLLQDIVCAFGPDHLDTLQVRFGLARWRLVAGDQAGAVAAFEELLPATVRALGPDHPTTLRARRDLARSRGEAGDPAGAVAAFEELLPDTLRALGPDHPETLYDRGELARWRGEAGDLAGAVAAFEELLPDVLRLLGPAGPDHLGTLRARGELARWRGEAGDPAGAVAAFEELLPDTLRALGPNHPITVATRHNLARWRARVVGRGVPNRQHEKPSQPGSAASS
jgi:hypothetical protein